MSKCCLYLKTSTIASTLFQTTPLPPGGYILQQPQKYVLYFLNEIKTEENFHRLPRLTTTEILEGQTS